MKKNPSALIALVTAAFSAMLFSPGNIHAQADSWHENVTIDAAAPERPWLGIAILDITPDLSKSLHTYVNEGLLVSDVNNGGPADSAGVDIGDVILKLDGVEIKDAGDFISRIKGRSAGATVNLQVSRNGAVEEMEVTLGRMPYLPPASSLLDIPASSPIINVRSTGEAEAVQAAALADQAEPSSDVLDISGQSDDDSGRVMCRRDAPAGLFHDQHKSAVHTCASVGQSTGDWNYGKIYMMAMEALDLTPDQRIKADGLWPEYLKKTIRSGAEIKVAEIELAELISSEPVNLEKVKLKIADISSKRSELRFYKIKTMEEFKKILTAEQRERLKAKMPRESLLLTNERAASAGCDQSGRGKVSLSVPTDLSDASIDPVVE